jgi:hypothetical protein
VVRNHGRREIRNLEIARIRIAAEDRFQGELTLRHLLARQLDFLEHGSGGEMRLDQVGLLPLAEAVLFFGESRDVG